MFINADQWRTAAFDAFRETIIRVTGLKRSAFDFQIQSHNHTAAIQWQWNDDRTKAQIILYLPVMKPGTKLTRKDADALAGFWIHESAHALYSDRDAWDAACRKGSGFRNLVNGLEDIRIERELIAANTVPGARKCLEAITARHVWQSPVNGATVNNKRAVAALIAYIGRAKLLGYDLPLADDMLAALTDGNRKLVADVLADVAKAKTSWDINAIVEKHFTQIPDQDDDQAPNPDQGDDAQGDDQGDNGERDDMSEIDPDGNGQDDDAQGGEKSDDESDDDAQGQGQGDDASDDAQDDAQGNAQGDDQGDDAQGETQGDNQDETSGAGQSESGHDDLNDIDALNDEIDGGDAGDFVKDIADEINGGPVDWETGALIDRCDGMRNRKGRGDEINPRAFDSLKAKVDGIGTLRAAVRRLVLSPDRVQWARRLENGRFDVRAAARVRIGQRDVFAKRSESEGHRAAVAILCDTSYSMGGNATGQAAMAAHVAETVEAAGCDVSVWAFGGRGTLTRVKGFGERVKRVAGRFVAAARADVSSTPLSESVLKVSSELQKVDATAHILFALTDGGDNNGATPLAIDMAKARGQIVVGVLIGRGDANQFDNADATVCVSNGAQLSGAVLNALVAELDKRKPGRAA